MQKILLDKKYTLLGKLNIIMMAISYIVLLNILGVKVF